uniref:Uncharacterized protein n=1 Tax=Arundo donax TaxID=35708 RepID=A0A0A9C767_ARUDO
MLNFAFSVCTIQFVNQGFCKHRSPSSMQWLGGRSSTVGSRNEQPGPGCIRDNKFISAGRTTQAIAPCLRCRVPTRFQ